MFLTVSTARPPHAREKVGIWRDETKKKLVVAFRGTEKWQDVLTDVNILLVRGTEPSS